MEMSHVNIIKFLKSKQKNINIEGILGDISWQQPTVLVVILSIISYMCYIYKFYQQQYPITLYCNSLYSHFTEQLLILNKMPYYKIYNPYINNITYYTTSKKKTVNINPTVKDWVNENIQLHPLDVESLVLLSNHLNIDINVIISAQNKVLDLLPEINAYHIIRENYIENEDYVMGIQNVQRVVKIHDHMYKIETNDHHYYTNLILSDDVLLNIGDVINGFYYSQSDDQIYIENKYIVNDQYQLASLNKKLKEDIVALPFYNLEVPRSTLKIHPFHLPKSKDPILSLLIVTQLLINYFLNCSN